MNSYGSGTMPPPHIDSYNPYRPVWWCSTSASLHSFPQGHYRLPLGLASPPISCFPFLCSATATCLWQISKTKHLYGVPYIHVITNRNKQCFSPYFYISRNKQQQKGYRFSLMGCKRHCTSLTPLQIPYVVTLRALLLQSYIHTKKSSEPITYRPGNLPSLVAYNAAETTILGYNFQSLNASCCCGLPLVISLFIGSYHTVPFTQLLASTHGGSTCVARFC